MNEVSIKQVADFFLNDESGNKPAGSLSGFSKEWAALPQSDKDQIRAGIGSGSFTY